MLLPGAPGATVDDLLRRAVGLLYGSRRVQRDRLQTAVPDQTTDTDLELTYAGSGIGRGMLIEADREVMYVWTHDPATGTSTVERGYDETPVGAHDAGTVVTIDPTFRRQTIFESMLTELRELNGHGLRAYVPVQISLDAAKAGYPLAAHVDPTEELLGVYSVTWRDGTGYERKVRYRFERHTQDGPVVQLLDWAAVRGPLTVTYTHRFFEFESEGEIVTEVTGVPPYAHQVLVYGAAHRTMVGEESRRVGLAGTSGGRQADEVPVGAQLGVAGEFRRLRDAALAAALATQQQLYPMSQRN